MFDVVPRGHSRRLCIAIVLVQLQSGAMRRVCCTNRRTLRAFDSTPAGGRELNRSDLWEWLWQKIKRAQEVRRDRGSKSTPVTLGWALPQLAPAEMWEGGCALRKTALTLKRGRGWKRAKSHRQGEIETERRGGNRESKTEWARTIRGSGLPKHDLSN